MFLIYKNSLLLLKKVSDTLASIKGNAPITELDEKIMHYYNYKTFCSDPTNILNSLPLSKMKDKKREIFFILTETKILQYFQ